MVSFVPPGSDRPQEPVPAVSPIRAADPETIGRAWGYTPRSVVWPQHGRGPAAAIFGDERSVRRVCVSPRCEETHILSMSLTPCHLEFLVDGEMLCDDRIEPGQIEILCAGREALGRVSGDWEVLQIYVPKSDIHATAEDMGVASVDARRIEPLDPRFARDPGLSALLRRLVRRMRSRTPVSRLEFDETMLELAVALVARYAADRARGRAVASRLTARELRRVGEILLDGLNPGLVDLSRALDRTAVEVVLAFRATLGTDPSAVYLGRSLHA